MMRLATPCIVLGLAIGLPGRVLAADASEPRVQATELEPDAFGFSVTELAEATGARIRGLLGTRSAVERVRALADPAALNFQHYAAVDEVLQAWTSRTSMAGMVRINQPLKPGFINVYLLEHRYLEAQAPRLACGCSYVPDSWSIVCDAKFLTSAQYLLYRRKSDPAAFDDKPDINAVVETMYRGFLLDWIIAHELGHLMRGHTEQDFHRAWTYQDGQHIGLAAEKEADEFYISRLQHRQDRQVAAWLGLSALITRLYGERVRQDNPAAFIAQQIAQYGDRYLFRAEYGIRLGYAPDQHPPLLLRALNLAGLVLERYPNMYDNSGYFDRIRQHVTLDPARPPETPEMCRLDEPDDGGDGRQLLLAKHWTLLRAQSAPEAWLRADVAALRIADGQQTEPRAQAIATAMTALYEAASAEDAGVAGPAIAAVEARSQSLPVGGADAVALAAAALKARLGLLADQQAVREALERAQEQLDSMAGQGLIDTSQTPERAEALRLVLDIALARNKDRGGAVEGVIDQVFENLVNLQDVAAMDRALFLEDLQADFAWAADVEKVDPTPRHRLVAANAALRITMLADAQDWRSIKVRYEAASLPLLEAMTPPPYVQLISGYEDLARTLFFLGMGEQSPALNQRALARIDAYLAVGAGMTDEDRTRAVAWRLKLLNNLGWSLVANKQFTEALEPLGEALSARVAARAGREGCLKGDAGDTEFATVNQNLADAHLALGHYPAALAAAHTARLCRTGLETAFKANESAKTEAYAMIFSGQQTEGKALLESYSAALRSALDDDVLPAGDPFLSGAIVDGTFVPLERFVTMPDKYKALSKTFQEATPAAEAVPP